MKVHIHVQNKGWIRWFFNNLKTKKSSLMLKKIFASFCYWPKFLIYFPLDRKIQIQFPAKKRTFDEWINSFSLSCQKRLIKNWHRLTFSEKLMMIFLLLPVSLPIPLSHIWDWEQVLWVGPPQGRLHWGKQEGRYWMVITWIKVLFYI